MSFNMKTNSFTLNEAAVAERVKEHLIVNGFKIKPQIRVRGRYPDIVAMKNGKITMVEVKGSMGDLKDGISRAIDYTYGAHYSYLAVPTSKSSQSLRQTMKNLGLGLIEVSEKEVKEAVKPDLSEPLPSVRKRLLKKSARGLERRHAPSKHTMLARVSRHKDIIKLLLKYPDRTFTVRELSKLSKASYSTTWRLIKDLHGTGTISTERIGPSVSVRLNKKSSFVPEIRKILEIEPSPHRLAAKEFAEKAREIESVERIILFGSVAKGIEKLSSDVDIAVIADSMKDKRKIERIADRILKTMQINIIPLIMTREEAVENPQFREELEKGETMYERGKRG
ncbi:MAG: hypothetical protein D6733_06805 [Methanobacteriota archaeon]|nr:MAG: hypothetical protein D6733_06805 [Euryarchaeota archaeon]